MRKTTYHQVKSKVMASTMTGKGQILRNMAYHQVKRNVMASAMTDCEKDDISSS